MLMNYHIINLGCVLSVFTGTLEEAAQKGTIISSFCDRITCLETYYRMHGK
jgi:hypothetical protein